MFLHLLLRSGPHLFSAWTNLSCSSSSTSCVADSTPVLPQPHCVALGLGDGSIYFFWLPGLGGSSGTMEEKMGAGVPQGLSFLVLLLILGLV